MIALAIDASTARGTVAILDGTSVLAAGDVAMRNPHAEELLPAVDQVMERAGLTLAKIDRVICGSGPGSFTSLRIAAGIAKGIAFGCGAPLYAVPSLGLMLASSTVTPGRFAVTLDALRGELYAAVWIRAADGSVRAETPTVLIPANEREAFAAAHGSSVLAAVDPHASGARYLLEAIDATGPVDLDRWEPAYGRLAEAQVRWEAVHGPLRA